MKQFKYFWICFNTILISACAGFETKPYSFSNQSTNFLDEYCQSGKQKKEFKTTVIYYLPRVEKGIPLDKASYKNKRIVKEKNDLLKNLFYLLGNERTQTSIANHEEMLSMDAHLLVAENEKDVLKNIEEDDSDTKYRLYTFIVKILNQNKIIIYQSNQESPRMNYDKGFSIDLNELRSNYTLLAPKEVMEEIIGEEFNNSSHYLFIILNESGEVDLSKAIENRDSLWHTYLTKFTTVKESADDYSKKATVELSLDLNTFCKYGRKISDLQSQ